MTATFDPTLSNDLSKVRFHVGDTNVDAPYLQDETIEALLVETASVGQTVIQCITFIITQLSTPNFSEDWLSVNAEPARKAFAELLKIKQAEFGISYVVATSTIALPYRADSDQDSSVATYADDKFGSSDEFSE